MSENNLVEKFRDVLEGVYLITYYATPPLLLMLFTLFLDIKNELKDIQLSMIHRMVIAVLLIAIVSGMFVHMDRQEVESSECGDYYKKE